MNKYFLGKVKAIYQKEFLKLAKQTALDGVKLIDEIRKVFKNKSQEQ